MSIASKLKQSNRKAVELIHQRDAVTGEPVTDDDGSPLKLIIRRLNAQDVLLKAGGPALLNLFGAAKDGETTVEQQERTTKELLADPQKLKESAEFYMRLVRTVVSEGVVNVPIVDRPEAELKDDEITPEMLGDDLPRVFNEIARFSGIPFTAQEVAATQRFPEEQVAADPRSDGSSLRHDPERDVTAELR